MVPYTLQRFSNWPPYKIWYYAIYLINDLKLSYFCIVHTNLSIYRKKTRIHVQNHPCGTVSAKIAYVLAVLVHGMVGCYIWSECILRLLPFMKNIKQGENEHCRTRLSHRNDSCRHPHQTSMLRVVIKVAICLIFCY